MGWITSAHFKLSATQIKCRLEDTVNGLLIKKKSCVFIRAVSIEFVSQFVFDLTCCFSSICNCYASGYSYLWILVIFPPSVTFWSMFCRFVCYFCHPDRERNRLCFMDFSTFVLLYRKTKLCVHFFPSTKKKTNIYSVRRS